MEMPPRVNNERAQSDLNCRNSLDGQADLGLAKDESLGTKEPAIASTDVISTALIVTYRRRFFKKPS